MIARFWFCFWNDVSKKKFKNMVIFLIETCFYSTLHDCKNWLNIFSSTYSKSTVISTSLVSCILQESILNPVSFILAALPLNEILFSIRHLGRFIIVNHMLVFIWVFFVVHVVSTVMVRVSSRVGGECFKVVT